jgi:hypothetical protein
LNGASNPDLKAKQSFLALQVELVNTEDRIQASSPGTILMLTRVFAMRHRSRALFRRKKGHGHRAHSEQNYRCLDFYKHIHNFVHSLDLKDQQNAQYGDGYDGKKREDSNDRFHDGFSSNR